MKSNKQAPEPGSPIANLKKAAKRANDEGDTAQAAKLAKAVENLEKFDQASPAPPKRPKMTDAEQSAEFEKVAREHGAEGTEAEFDGMLRKLAKPKA